MYLSFHLDVDNGFSTVLFQLVNLCPKPKIFQKFVSNCLLIYKVCSEINKDEAVINTGRYEQSMKH